MKNENAQPVGAEVIPGSDDVVFVIPQGKSTEGKNTSIDHSVLGQLILASVDWAASEQREGKRGTFHTTTQHSWYMDGPDGQRYQIGLSVNRYAAETATQAKASGQKFDGYKLAPADIALIDKSLAVFTDAGDVPNATKLATIKAVFGATGYVSRDQLMVVMSLKA